MSLWAKAHAGPGRRGGPAAPGAARPTRPGPLDKPRPAARIAAAASSPAGSSSQGVDAQVTQVTPARRLRSAALSIRVVTSRGSSHSRPAPKVLKRPSQAAITTENMRLEELCFCGGPRLAITPSAASSPTAAAAVSAACTHSRNNYGRRRSLVLAEAETARSSRQAQTDGRGSLHPRPSER